MRAVVFEHAAQDVSATRIVDLPSPVPGVGEVLIRVTHAGVNFKDVMVRRGDPGYVDVWPTVPGMEVAGTVVATGRDVAELAIGDRVAALTNSGGMAELVNVSAALAVRVPETVSSAVASAVPGVWATAEVLLRDVARIRSGDAIVVHSASGAVGAALAQLVARLGDVTLIGLVGSQSRLAGARLAGYDAAFVRGPDLAQAVRAQLGGRGADVLLDPQGTDWLEEDLNMLAAGGRVVLFGNASGGQLGALPPASVLYANNVSVGGFSLAAMSKNAPSVLGAAMRRIFDRIVDGTIDPRVTVVPGLESASAIQQRLADGAGAGKYVVDVAAGSTAE